MNKYVQDQCLEELYLCNSADDGQMIAEVSLNIMKNSIEERLNSLLGAK